MKFTKFPSALLRYNDPTYDPKRLWVSRLLTLFMMDDFYIISIDESNFKSDSINTMQWVPDDKVGVSYYNLKGENFTNFLKSVSLIFRFTCSL